MKNRLTANAYVEGILSHDRLVLSRAITLIESALPDDVVLAQAVLSAVLPHTGRSVRVGITGVPGVGKSTFIESLGKHLTDQNQKIAVLTIDPTSQRTHGSIMGDKTRMETLAHDPNAYIRPSPSGSSLGGVAHRTRETMLLCEAAGFEIIMVETVGVGQSETVVKGMVDFFLLLMLAGAGDELQGIKKGIIEMADALVITKADGDNATMVQRAIIEYQNALHLFRPTDNGWTAPVQSCSALHQTGIQEVWQLIEQFAEKTKHNGHWQQNRQGQNLAWMHSHIKQTLETQFYGQPKIQEMLSVIESDVLNGSLLPLQAAKQLLTR